jgi:hypothetical protein
MGKSSSKKTKSNRKLLALSIGLSVIIILGFVAYKMVFQNQETRFSLKAAIVDQLSQHFPNATFITRATNLLKNAGFNVSYFSYENVTVPFYKKLVEGSYGIIIFRAHSAIRVNETIVDLFTSEEYHENEYSEYSGLLSVAEYLVPLGNSSGKFYFAITPDFIEHFGHFPESIVIAMGCSSLRVNCYEMAQSFIDRGAKAYVGWSEIVTPEDTDYETARFLEKFLGENETLSRSVKMTNSHTYYDPNRNTPVTTGMDYYPPSSYVEDLKIHDLIAEAESSKGLMTFENLEQFSLVIANINSRRKDFSADCVGFAD